MIAQRLLVGTAALVLIGGLAACAPAAEPVAEPETPEPTPTAVETTEPMLQDALFGATPAAEALIAERAGAAIGFAIFYHTFSTWTGRRGIWLFAF